MRRLKFTVVIPVKYFHDSIAFTMKTILEQDYENFEVVISDAGHSDKLKNFLEAINDPRIHYFRPQESVSFSDDWDFALNKAVGDYITVLGDDDGLVPGALSHANEVIKKHECQALTWKKINYNWPDHLITDQQCVFEGESSPILQIISAKNALKMLANFKLGYARLPCIYNSFVQKKVIDSIREGSTQKKFFCGVIPDVYSAIVISAAIRSYVYVSYPLSINGASRGSSGVMQGIPELDLESKKQIKDVLSSHHHYHKHIGRFSTSIASIVMGEYILATTKMRSLDFPKPNWRAYVRYLHYEASHALHPDLILQSASHTMRMRNISNFWFFRRKKANHPPGFGFIGRMTFPRNLVKNVFEASQFCDCLIPREASFGNSGRKQAFIALVSKILILCLRFYQEFSILEKNSQTRKSKKISLLGRLAKGASFVRVD